MTTTSWHFEWLLTGGLTVFGFPEILISTFAVYQFLLAFYSVLKQFVVAAPHLFDQQVEVRPGTAVFPVSFAKCLMHKVLLSL